MGKKWVFALLAAGAGLVAAAAYGHVVVARTAYASHTLPGHRPTEFTLSCGRGFVAASAGVVSPARDAQLLRLEPVDTRSFAFGFANPGAAARVRVAVACRRSSYRGPVLRQTRLERRVVVPADGFASVRLTCPRQTTAAGSGVDLAGGAVTLRRTVATVHGFAFTFRNDTPKPQRIAAYGNCLTAVSPAGAAVEPLRVEITSFTDLIATGSQAVRHACRKGWISIGTGYKLGRPALDVRGGIAVGATGRWRVQNASSTDATAVLQLTCAMLGR